MRSQIVREVRGEYLDIVQRLEGDLPTQEYVQWRHSGRLCWPHHVLSGRTPPLEGSRDERAAAAAAAAAAVVVVDTGNCSDREGHMDEREEEEELMEKEEEILLQTVTREKEEEEEEKSVLDGESALSENTSDCIENEQVAVNCEHSPPPSPSPHPPLPQDREGLLKLRSQLVMELVWVQQAVTSRQRVSLNNTSSPVL